MSSSRSRSPSPPLTPPTSDSECDSERHGSSPSSHVSTRRTIPISTPSPHPLAASTKADRSPPVYKKKLFTPPATPPEPKKDISARQVQEFGERGRGRERWGTAFQRSPSMAETEKERWDTAISSAVDRADPKLDLRCAYTSTENRQFALDV